MPLCITGIFYEYTTITGTESLSADIATFVGSVAIGQFVGYRTMIKDPLPSALHKASIAGIISLGITYPILTFYPPQLPLFLNLVTGTYGIP